MFILVCTVLIALCYVSGASASISVSVDRNPVQINESFRILFETNVSVSGKPDFTALEKDFDILSQGQSSNIRIINGDYSATTQWTLDVMAKRTGKLTIPSIQIGGERSPPKSIVVQKATRSQSSSAGDDIFLEVDAKPDNPYVQEEIIYSVRLFRAVKIHNASLTEPQLSGAKAVIEKLGDDVTFNTTRDGKRYMVIERKYAIFPQSSGPITIEPVLFEGQLGGGSRYLFDPFGRGARTTRIRSDSIELQARPVPQSFGGTVWLPARQLELVEAWSDDPPIFRAGEPVTRTLALIAGGLTSSQLPEIRSAVPTGIKLYPDQPKLEDKTDASGVVGVRQEKIALIPSQAGKSILPAIEIPWWNTETDTFEIARLPEREIAVQPAATARSATAPVVTPALPPAPENLSEAKKQPTAIPIAEGMGSTATTQTPNWWILTSIVLALGWAGTALLWWRSGHKREGRQQSDIKMKRRAAIRSIKKACQRHDSQAAKDALMQWAKIQWYEHPPNHIDEVGRRVGGTLRNEIERLHQQLYGRAAKNWNGSALWTAFEIGYKKLNQPEGKPRFDLEPLYKA